MADDLMDFTESTSDQKFVDDQDENAGIMSAPRLVQSPVIVNSILKQSTKDNLIQLYTPVQKPDKGKLKVHFGSDSLLQTPNVKTGKKKAADARGIKFSDIVESPTNKGPKLSTEESSEGVTCVNAIVNEILDKIPVQNDESKGDNSETKNEQINGETIENKEEAAAAVSSNADESAMDISVCEVPPSNVSENADNDNASTLDVILQAELLLKSLRGEDAEETSKAVEIPKEVDDTSKVEQTTVLEENVAKSAEGTRITGVNVDGQVLGTNILHKEEQDVTGVNVNVEEPMDDEEEMEVDDEIVFNFPKGINNAHVNDQVIQSQNAQVNNVILKNEEVEHLSVETENESSKDVEYGHAQIMNEVEDVLSSSLNGLVSSDMPDFEPEKDVPEEKSNVDQQLAKGNESNEPTFSNLKDKPVETNIVENLSKVQEKTTVEKGRTKIGDDSSDDEFMSADEDMEVDVVKTPMKSKTDVSNIEQDVVNKEDSPERIPPKVGYNLNFDDLEAMDPFSSKKSLMNSPDVGKSETKLKQEPAPVVNEKTSLESQEDDKIVAENSSGKAKTDEKTVQIPESPKPSKIPNPEILLSPNAVLVDKVCQDKNAGNIFDEKIDCLSDEEKVMENVNADVSLSGKTLDFAACTEGDIEFIDPFKPKQQICNTPDKQLESNSDNKTSNQLDIKGSTAENHPDSESENVIDNIDKPKVPVINKSNEMKDNENTEVSSTPEEKKDDSQPAVATPVKVDTPSLLASPAIPVSKGVYNLDALDFDDIDPFKPKKQMDNSPCSKPAAVQPELDDPFKPKKQIMNSPVANKTGASSAQTVTEPVNEPGTVDNAAVDIKDTSACQESQNEPIQLNTDVVVPDSVKEGINETEKEEKIAEDVSRKETVEKEKEVTNQIKKELTKKPSSKKETTERRSEKEKVSNVTNRSGDTIADDPFADLNPFQTKSKVANTPEKVPEKPEETGVNFDKLDEINPFATKSKICNSPNAKDDNPFVTKSCVANSPVKNEEQLKDTEETKKTPPQGLSVGIDDSNEIFEVQGVTRRGEENLSQMDQFGDVDESQFVSASQVFNDPGVWEMLENIGTSTNKEESSLSRMSLYVKFDPLVDAAPINPRRVSIRFSQLEKVKEYGVDDTLLLLGTPPSKRRQSVTASQAKIPPSGSRGTSAPTASLFSKDAEPVDSEPAPVDLIFAYSPKEKEKKDDKKPVQNENIAMSLMDEDGLSEESENLFQELKYTDLDLKKIRMEMKLALQGTLMNKEQEWCKKYKQLEKEKAEVIKKLESVKKDKADLKTVYMFLEQTVGEITAERDNAKRKIEEIASERDQALQDIASIENAFSILNGRFDKSKNMIQTMMKNDEVVKKYAADLQEKLKQQDKKYQTLEKSSKQKIAESSQEIEKLKHQVESMQEKFNAQLKLMQMKNESLEKSIETKKEENKQLTEICDNLLAKVAQDSSS